MPGVNSLLISSDHRNCERKWKLRHSTCRCGRNLQSSLFQLLTEIVHFSFVIRSCFRTNALTVLWLLNVCGTEVATASHRQLHLSICSLPQISNQLQSNWFAGKQENQLFISLSHLSAFLVVDSNMMLRSASQVHTAACSTRTSTSARPLPLLPRQTLVIARSGDGPGVQDLLDRDFK